MLRVVRSKDDPKAVQPRLQLDPNWRVPRDPTTGQLRAEGRLWAFADKIAASRREGKNRRDGATVSTRVLALADRVGARLFDEAIKAANNKSGMPVTLTPEEADTMQKQAATASNGGSGSSSGNESGEADNRKSRRRRRRFDPQKPPSARL